MELQLKVSDNMQERIVITPPLIVFDELFVSPAEFVEKNDLLVAHYLAGNGRTVSFRM